jgi:hypothetical protein
VRSAALLMLLLPLPLPLPLWHIMRLLRCSVAISRTNYRRAAHGMLSD